MIISAIVGQKHKRYEIQVDGESILSVHEDVLVKYGLHKGMEVEPTDLTEIIEAQERHYVIQAFFRYVSYRPRTVRESEQHLSQKGFDSTLIQSVLKSMNQQGYLDDRQYARNWIRERQTGKKLGINRLKQELKRKGVPSEYIDEAIEEENIEEERQLVTEVAERRYSRICKEDWQTIERRLGSYLLRRGFPSHLVRQALQHIRNKRNQEES
ncbi:RecX family transcriptional regulator [Shimazuella kribbensis]|uniref:RecX family transcriptional regulator n=1 Tax=Shimazuella kribbensis TaxID=139808 RepID=UPI00048AB1A1|nr:RecX family transcriptional regulator [Shimazuella kribbensis]